jgi:hypothetical protein
MLNKIYKVSFISTIITSPLFALAQLTGTRGLFENAYEIVRTILIPLVFTLALLFFFYGVAKYIWSVGTGKEEGRKVMIWGIIALFVMSCIWGIIYFIGQEIGGGVGDTYNMHIPTIGG